MSIELDEVVVQDVSDDALEKAAGGAQGGGVKHMHKQWRVVRCRVLDLAAPVTRNLGVCYEY